MPKQKKSPPLATSREDNTAERVYAKFIGTLGLVGIGLKSCTANLQREALYSLGKKSDRTITHDYELTHIEETAFDVQGTYRLAIGEADSDAPAALVIECIFEAHIHAKPPFTRVQAERFAKSELRLILVPYARQFVSGISSQMAIPPVILPLTTRSKDEQ